MKLYSGWNEQACKDIAREADNEQVVRDVQYGRFIHHHHPATLYCERIDDKAFLLGQVQKDKFRIIGMGTKTAYKRQGFGSLLLQRCEEFAKNKGLDKITTRSLSGADFYARRGFDVVGVGGGIYLLEKYLQK